MPDSYVIYPQFCRVFRIKYYFTLKIRRTYFSSRVSYCRRWNTTTIIANDKKKKTTILSESRFVAGYRGDHWNPLPCPRDHGNPEKNKKKIYICVWDVASGALRNCTLRRTVDLTRIQRIQSIRRFRVSFSPPRRAKYPGISEDRFPNTPTRCRIVT